MRKQQKIIDPYSIRTRKNGHEWSPEAIGQWQGEELVKRQIKMLILSGADEIEVIRDGKIIESWVR